MESSQNNNQKRRFLLLLGGLQQPHSERNNKSRRMLLNDDDTLADLRQKLIGLDQKEFVPDKGAFTFRYHDDEEDCEVEIWQGYEHELPAKDFVGKKLTPIPTTTTTTASSSRGIRDGTRLSVVAPAAASATRVVSETSDRSTQKEDTSDSRSAKEESTSLASVMAVSPRDDDDTTASGQVEGEPPKKRARRNNSARDIGIKQEHPMALVVDLTGEDDSDSGIEDDENLTVKSTNSQGKPAPADPVPCANASGSVSSINIRSSSVATSTLSGGSGRPGPKLAFASQEEEELVPARVRSQPDISSHDPPLATAVDGTANAVDENINDDPCQAAPVTSHSLHPKVKEELARQKSKKERKEVYKKYADRHLLDRQDIQYGIARLGGGVQTTDPHPKQGHPNIYRVYDKRGNIQYRNDYPFPKHVLSSEAFLNRELLDMGDFAYLCSDELWQPNAPKYAGQPFGAFDYFPKQFIKTDKACPVFVKRSRTTKHQENEGGRMGWEYIGNYKYSSSLDDDNADAEDLGGYSYWESASNFSRASKKKIAEKTLQSSLSETGYGRREIDEWRQRIMAALERDDSPAAPSYLVEKREPTEDEKRDKLPSMAARARALGFDEDMSDRDFLYLLVELNEFHKQINVEFVEYDEHVYEYVKNGKTKNNRFGKKATAHSPAATAGDWYDFAEEHMLM